MKDWEFAYEGFDPEKEGLREALCTLGNGYFATRGAGPETSAGAPHYPGTYLAGGYNRLLTRVGDRDLENEDLVNMPNWLPLNFRIEDGPWFALNEVILHEYRQWMDLKQGELHRTMRFQDAQGRECILDMRRIVHMFQPHLAAEELRLTAVNWNGSVSVRSALDGTVINAGVDRYKKLSSQHLKPISQEVCGEDTVALKVQTVQSELCVAMASRFQVFNGDTPLPLERRVIESPGYIAHELDLQMAEGGTVVLEKIVSLFSSRDQAISEPGLEAQRLVVRPGRYADLAVSHALAWNQIWRRFDMRFQLRDPEATEHTLRILRLYILHLVQTVSPNSRHIDAGVPARGWHGEAYRGHIFWDELFIFPMLNYRIPEITRALLFYRYRRMGEARYAAREAGFRGALFPWQSGSDGREETQQMHLNPKSGRWIPDNSSLQRHVNGAIAYNVWKYYQVTQDVEFLSFFGAEMLLEIARFFGSLATYNSDMERYEILGVVGPDEYHEAYPDREESGLDNNAYTNVLGVWVLCRALDVLKLLPDKRRRDLCEVLHLQEEELEHWDAVSRKMRVCFHGDGIISQFEDYDSLEEFDWDGYRAKYGDIQRLDRILEAEGDTPNRYKLSKQADVLMLFYLFSPEALGELFSRLGYEFNLEMIDRNVQYYMNRTSHGSTLSRVVHSYVLVRTDRRGSWQQFLEALESDVADVQGGTTPEGIHLGAMAGSVDLIQRAYTGIEARDDVLWLSPRLPEEVTDLELHVVYRGASLALTVDHQRLTVTVDSSSDMPVSVGYNGETFSLLNGETRVFERPPVG